MIRNAPIVFILVFLSCTSNNSKKETLHAENSDLKVGIETPVSTLKQHAADTFRVDLDSGAFVSGFADQRTVDIVLEVYGPDKKMIASWDGPARGPELFQFTSKTRGIHRIVVAPFKENVGEYLLILTGAEELAKDPDARAGQLVRASLGGEKISPGVSIAVQKDGKIIYSNGFGYANLEDEIKNTPTTIFHIASISKQFTAFSIALLADQGKLSLDDDIRKYLPELHDFGAVVTINHLVHHTSGLRDHWDLLQMAGWRMDDVITQNQIMRLVSKQKNLNFKPGEEMLYCNTGYTLMAEIVNRVTHESFTDWTKKNIFDPLGMTNTFFYMDHERMVKGRAYSYYRSTEGYKKSVLNYANAGATSLFTTVEDLSLWAVNYETMKVGNANVMKMMQQRFILNKGDTISYAFGQVINKYKGLNSFSHGGADAGYRTFLLRFPDQHFSVSVFSNLASSSPGAISYALADLFLSDQFIIEKANAQTQTPQAPVAENQPFDSRSLKLSDYEGKFYSDELETSYTLAVVNDTLTAHHQRHDDLKLIPFKRDGFMARILGSVEFSRDKKEQITGFKASSGRARNLEFNRE